MALERQWRLGGLLAAAATASCLDLSASQWTFAGTDAGITPDSGPGFVPAPHLPWPQLVNDGGQVIASPRLVTLAASNDVLAPNLFSLANAIVESPWLAQVGAEYGVGAASSGGSFVGAPLPVDGGPTSLTWTDLTDYARAAVAAGAPLPDGRTVYLAFMPPGTTIYGSLNAYWSAFSLADAGATGDMLLAIPSAAPFPGESPFDALSRLATEHLIGVTTDPWPPLGPAWLLPLDAPPVGSPMVVDQTAAYRAGDLCRNTRILETTDAGTFVFSRSWSNAAAARGGDPCIPATAQAYYNVSFPQTWYAVDAGASVTVPLTGWSTQPTGDWLVYVSAYTSGGFSAWTASSVVVTTDAGLEQVGNCTPMPGMNNGVPGSLQFTVPPGVVSGDSATLFVTSVFLDPTLCSDPQVSFGDVKHLGYVGVYAP
jgi:hypothetical protein